MLAFVNLLLVVACWAIVFHSYPMLPEKIPTHYGFHGPPDELGSKSTIFEVPLIQTGLFLFLFTLALLVKRYPKIYNFQVDPKLLSYEGKEELYSLTRELILAAGIAINLLFVYLAVTTINVALGKWNGVNGYIVGLLIGILSVIIICYFIKTKQIRN